MAGSASSITVLACDNRDGVSLYTHKWVGVGLRTIAQLMGHKTIQLTMRYAHLAPAHQLAAVECLVSQPSVGSAAQAEPSDTTTDTSTESVSRFGLAAIN
jgi:hypothetical protein